MRKAVVDVWFFRHTHQQKHSSMPLKEFLADLAMAPVLIQKRPSRRPAKEQAPSAKKETMATLRAQADLKWQWNRCKACSGGYILHCSKCKVSMCIKKNRNCFVESLSGLLCWVIEYNVNKLVYWHRMALCIFTAHCCNIQHCITFVLVKNFVSSQWVLLLVVLAAALKKIFALELDFYHREIMD